MTKLQSEAMRLAYEYAASNEAQSCCTKVDRFMAGFKAAVEQAEKLNEDSLDQYWKLVEDLKALL